MFSAYVPGLSQCLGIPSSRIPIDVDTFVSYVLPPVVCYFVVALLVVTPETRVVRAALWPIVALLALRAALSVDMSLGRPERTFLNVDLVLSMVNIITRTLEWTLVKGPLVRHRLANGSSSTIMDALDLASNLRGRGWQWSRGLYIPRETRPVNNRMAFAFWTFLSAVGHILLCGALQRAILTLAPVRSISEGSSIFDDSLPFLVRYLRASIITTFTAFAIYAVLQQGYDACTISNILLFRQDPAEWPPAFDAPWCATSLSDFWGRRWHQWFRHMFLVGAYPLSLVFGRAGAIVGAFLTSAVFHQISMVALNSQVKFWRMLLGFGMMAPGILAERGFYRLTGRKVGGVIGWVWTMIWLQVWGIVMVEGFARGGMFGCAGFVDSILPVQIPVERWVADFDAWLHTV